MKHHFTGDVLYTPHLDGCNTSIGCVNEVDESVNTEPEQEGATNSNNDDDVSQTFTNEQSNLDGPMSEDHEEEESSGEE